VEAAEAGQRGRLLGRGAFPGVCRSGEGARSFRPLPRMPLCTQSNLRRMQGLGRRMHLQSACTARDRSTCASLVRGAVITTVSHEKPSQTREMILDCRGCTSPNQRARSKLSGSLSVAANQSRCMPTEALEQNLTPNANRRICGNRRRRARARMWRPPRRRRTISWTRCSAPS